MKLLDTIKAKAQAVSMMPKIMKVLPEYQGKTPDELKEEVISVIVEKTTLEAEDNFSKEKSEELLVKIMACSSLYAMTTGMGQDQEKINEFIVECESQANDRLEKTGNEKEN